ncbi:MAG: FAD-binding oxidoreductase [Lachnospiraceae bacterium]|nr:FAD-binding oxidoreductase [Lachnospiraceae bacterium]
MRERFDGIIIGAGLYGLYAAHFLGKRGLKVLVLEKDSEPFMRATYINQARVHMGYHYPRSLTTAVKSAGYFRRFLDDFGFCIHRSFDQVYATSAKFSWTNAEQFREFCDAAGILCRELPASAYLKDGMCDGAFLTEEYTYDAHILRDHYLEELSKLPGVTLKTGCPVTSVLRETGSYVLACKDGEYETGFVLNATYASVNQILKMVPGCTGEDLFRIKYELCEIILGEPSEALKDTGITVMDGPFFSVMPFGKTGLHSLTAVTFTPHMASFEDTPVFRCQSPENACSPAQLSNCSSCPNRPKSAWPYMSHLAEKYLKEEFSIKYVKSLYSMKPILKSSEVDDSRPTAIRYLSEKPVFLSVLSGKINTVYDLDPYLEKCSDP